MTPTFTAIQDAIDAAPDCSTIELPPGTVDLTESLMLAGRNRVGLQSSSAAQTILNWIGPVGGACVEFRNSTRCRTQGVFFRTSSRFRANEERETPVSQLILGGTAGLRITWDGASLFNSVDNSARDCVFDGFDFGVQVGDGSQHSVSEQDFETCDFLHNVVGLFIDSGNGQNVMSRGRCRWSGNGTGVYCRNGGYSDQNSIFVNQLGTDIHYGNCQHSATLFNTWSEQSKRFLDTDGPTGTGFPLNLINCQMGSSSPIPGYEWYGSVAARIQHPGPINIIGGQLGGAGSIAATIAVGGQVTTPVKVDGLKAYCRWFPDGGEFYLPFVSMNDAMMLDGTWQESDIALVQPTRVRSRVGKVSPSHHYIYPPGHHQSASFAHHNNGTGDWSANSGSQVLDSNSVIPTVP